jgi:hypothetical protein
MTKRVLYSLVAAALCMVALLTALTVPAAAEKRTVWVELPNGRVVPVTVDIPPGTPLSKVKLPGRLTTPPTSTTPTDTTPTDTTPTAPGESPSAPQGRAQHPSHGRRARDKNQANAQPEVKPKRKRHHRRATPLRNPDGTPTARNPGFMDTLPGPSEATGVPNFVIQKFHVPPFLLPIYQAAGIQYGVRWEVLAAINEIETDYGRNLNVSSAGAVGWMQFLPSTWRRYGVDANRDHRRDPYNPVDAIFSAARYLKAAGYEHSVRRAILAYNHANWYVDSVMLRARLIAGVPADLIGSLTGLTEGRFPVYAHARYADDLAEQRQQLKRVKPGQNAAQVVASEAGRQGIDIFAREGAPVVAVNDGVIKKIGSSPRLGRYVVLQDVYGNRYTYAQLGSVQQLYPVPKAEATNPKQAAKAFAANRDQSLPRPTGPASAGRQPSNAKPAADATPQPAARRGSVPLKQRLFAHPDVPGARESGGLEQQIDARTRKHGIETFKNYFSRPYGVDSRDVRLRPLKRGSQVIGGTILGRIGKTDPTKAPHLHFEVRPAGKGAPRIDPKPLLDGWKLLEATAIYRASGRNALYGNGNGGLSIGQIILLPKPALERRVLSDPRIDIYAGGREDIRTGQIDRRVLATLEYLAESGLKPTVSSLKSGHGFLTTSGNVSEHSSGNAVDISAINGIPILGHQEPGGIAEQTVRMLMRLQGTLQPHQIISLLDLGGPTLAMADHANHIHVGFRPLFGSNRKLGKEILAVLRPGQWSDLLARLRKIDNPVVPTRPSRYALPDPRHAGPGE